MAKIAVIMADMFEDSEYTEPAKAFLRAGHTLVHVELEQGATVKGKKGATPVVVEREVTAVAAADFNALLVPGGYSPDKLRAHPAPVTFVKEFMESGKPVFVICHGPQFLTTARVLTGRRITGWKSIIQDILNAGAEFIDAEVVEDGNIVSSRSPEDLPAFITASLKKL